MDELQPDFGFGIVGLEPGSGFQTRVLSSKNSASFVRCTYTNYKLQLIPLSALSVNGLGSDCNPCVQIQADPKTQTRATSLTWIIHKNRSTDIDSLPHRLALTARDIVGARVLVAWGSNVLEEQGGMYVYWASGGNKFPIDWLSTERRVHICE